MTWHIVVSEYDEQWPELFQAEADLLRRVFGELLVDIHHIGSTSVPGLRAKPVIDMLPVVRDIEEVDTLNDKMRELGYEPMAELGLPGRRYFRKGGDRRTHHVHVYGVDNRSEIERHLAVRDYLRAHPDAAKEYGDLKANLARSSPDIEAYMDGKDAFVKCLEKKALAWTRARNTGRQGNN